jgi:hypothetical protein
MGRILPDLMGRINTNFVLASEIIKASVPFGAEAKNINRRARRERRAVSSKRLKT